MLYLLSHEDLYTGKYSKDWTKHLKQLTHLISDNLPKLMIIKEISPESILSKNINNNDTLAINTKVRVQLDVSKDITLQAKN